MFVQAVTKAAWLSDFEGAYEFKTHIKFAMGAQNALNVYPSKTPDVIRLSYLTTNSASFGTGKYLASPFGIDGGFYYGRVSWSF